MYKLNLQQIGHRLKQIREHINLSQVQLAEILGCRQNAISNIEQGKGASTTLLINLLNFYSDYVYIDCVFSEKFILISAKGEDEARKGHYNSFVSEIIKESHKALQEDLKETLRKHEDNLQKALDLLES